MTGNFLLGAATAAHQVEGNNTNSDCWAMEHMKHTTYAEPSLDTCDHYHRYEQDIEMLADAGLDAFRFSMEWARIEPERGHFSEEAMAHYMDVIRCCRKHSVEPVVTLHHFSSPRWLISLGGWESAQVIECFANYTRFVVEHIGSDVNYLCTINEANTGLEVAQLARRMIQQMKQSSVQVGINIEQMLKNKAASQEENLSVFGVREANTFTSARSEESDVIVCKAHRAAVEIIKKTAPHVKCGLTLSLHDIQAVPGGENAAEEQWDLEFRHYLPYINNDDFVGVQNYTRMRIGALGELPPPKGAILTQMGYEYYPESLEHVIRAVAAEYKGLILVTENGIAAEDDTLQCDFIEKALSGVERCHRDGINVGGYFYWSLLDNFEWQRGFGMKFGLVAVDRRNQTRIPKQSLKFLRPCAEKVFDKI